MNGELGELDRLGELVAEIYGLIFSSCKTVAREIVMSCTLADTRWHQNGTV